MVAMSELHYEIVEMIDKDFHPKVVAAILHIPVSMVYDALDAAEAEPYSPFETVNS
jgi:hypothetical protein